MEVVLNVGRFECLEQNEMLSIDGGANVGVGKALVATGGAALIAWAPIAALAIIATGGTALPVIATAVGTGLGVLGTGVTGVAVSLH